MQELKLSSRTYNFLENKKGISNIVATLLLVLLTVVAVTIVASFVVPLVKNGLGGTECFKYRDFYTFEEEFGYACHTGNDYAVSIRAKSLDSQELVPPKGFALLYWTGENSKSQRIINGEPISQVRMLDSSVANLVTPKNGEVRTYVYNSNGDEIEYVEVYPILEDDKICDKGDRINVDFLCEADHPIDTAT